MTPDLLPYQEIGAAWLASKRKAYLGDEPGLGKTRTALAAARQVGINRIAVICPAIVRDHWVREAEVVHPDAELHVESYQKLVLDPAARQLLLGNLPPRLLIVDEAHYCKHREAQRTKLLFGSTGLVQRVLTRVPEVGTTVPEMVTGAADDGLGRVWCLSGTPMPRNPYELWPVLFGLWPKYLVTRGFGSHMDWLNRFCAWRATDYGIKVFGARNVGELRELLAPILLRRKTVDVQPDLPRLRWNVLPITAEHLALPDLPMETREAFLRGELPPMDEAIARYRHEVGNLKAPFVAELLAEELMNDPRAKRVVFAYHHSVLDVLAYELTKFGLVQIRGNTPEWRRLDAVRAFREQDETRVFLGQINACATGMDGLQYAAHEAVMVEPDWATDVNIQAGHRLSRLGQTLPVQVRVISLAHTLDESIIRNHVRECRMVADVIG